ncbi:MAG: hypothetical protein ACR2HN_07865 [Tepidiformaceae bacterium]
MVQTSSVIYLPPGVMATSNLQPPAAVVSPGVPFDRNFFENVLPQAIGSFCNQVVCKMPIVELRTVDGTTHYVNGISGVSDAWVALHTSLVDHEHPVQVFIAYQTIFRVEIHPDADGHNSRLGFVLTARSVSAGPAAAAVVAPTARAAKPAAARATAKSTRFKAAAPPKK